LARRPNNRSRGSDTIVFYKNIMIIFMLIIPFQLEARQSAPEVIEDATIVDTEEFIELFDKYTNVVVIDSRLSSDRKQGYIEGSINLPDVLTDCNKLSSLVKVKQTPVVFYCNGEDCLRSSKAIKIAISCGYKNIYWLRGGFQEWLLKGYPYLRE